MIHDVCNTKIVFMKGSWLSFYAMCLVKWTFLEFPQTDELYKHCVAVTIIINWYIP